MAHIVSKHASRQRSRRGWWAGLAAAVLLAPLALVGCSSDSSGTPTLTWYINPDDGGQATLAKECGDQSGGAYRITTQVLPNTASDQRDQLVRRLAAGDSSIDLMSLDPVFVAEFANAGYLMPITDQADVDQLTADVLPAALEAAYWDDQLVAAPFWANTQLLWYRKSVAEAAGVDPTVEGFTWEQMIQAAESQGKTVAVQANRYEGYMVWINALTMSAGGQILENTDQGDEATPTMSAAPPGLSTATEEEARATFQGDGGGFMVNWSYIYAAAKSAVAAGGLDQSVVDDIAWARYPRVDAGMESKPPLGGINLAIGDASKHQEEALAAVKCITSVENNAQYMVETGNPAARAAAYDDPAVKEAFPMADLIRESIADAGPRPITPYYGDVSSSVQRVWHPAADVRSPQTPEETDSYMADVLSGKRLL